MLDRIGKDFSLVIAVDLDRLLRSTQDLNTLISLGAQVVTVDGEIDLSTADGEFRATKLAGIARFETRRSQERQRRSKRRAAENGEWLGGAAPYGYQVIDRQLVPNQSEIEAIEEAVHRLLDNREPMHSIVTDWNSPKVPGLPEPKRVTRSGKHWRSGNLRAILMNSSMLGETKAGIRPWEPIIEERTFDRIQALLNDPARKVTHSPGVKGGKYAMGGGLTVCGKCGRPLITAGKPRPTSEKTRQVALSCLARVNGTHESHPAEARMRMVYFGEDGRRVRSKAESVRSEKVEHWEDTGRVTIAHDALEEFVWAELIQKLEATPRWHDHPGRDNLEANPRIEELEAERSALRDQRERAGKAFVLGVMTEAEAQREVERISLAASAVDAEMNAILGQPRMSAALADAATDLDSAWRTWTPGLRRTALRGLIERVEVDAFPEGMGRGDMKKAVAARTRIIWKTSL